MSVSRRKFLASSALASAAFVAPRVETHAALANDAVNVGFIGAGGRGGQQMKYFSEISGVNIAGICDPDEGAIARGTKRFPKASSWKDLRRMLDDKSIDAVVITTCNHWHCLAAIWAMEAGKDVYVEKPLSHSQWEGRQTVHAARRYDRICQVGTQQRSDPMQAAIKKFLHEDKALGAIQTARVNRFGVRPPIGKRATPLKIDKNVDYDIWLGPAQDQPIFRNKLQYDWHWDWNTGSGEMGNWGVHVLDDLRNNVFQDKVALPKRILGAGGRVVFNDAGQTPNIHFVYFDTGDIPVVIALSNLTAGPQQKKSPKHPGPNSGYIAYCEGGRFEGQRGRGQAFDKDGKLIKTFKGNNGNQLHQQNFVDAVRKHDATMLNTDVEMGHLSTGWCNLANVAVRAGNRFVREDADIVKNDQGIWNKLVSEMEAHLGQHSIKLTDADIRLSPMLEVDVAKESFVGDTAAAANKFLKRKYRAPYVVPDLSPANV